MKLSTAGRILIAAVIFFFFGAFILRAALRLASTAMHSLFGMAVVLAILVWVLWKMRR